MTESPRLTFNDGNRIPQLGYGVWQVENDTAEKVVGLALEAGYRHIDTAKIYGNEEGTGKAIADSGVAREDVFLTTKIWNDDQGYEQALAAAEASLERLGTDYVDLRWFTGLSPPRVSTPRPGRPSSNCRSRVRPSPSASPTSPKRSCVKSSLKPALCPLSTRLSCTPTSPRKTCARSTQNLALSPRHGAPWATAPTCWITP